MAEAAIDLKNSMSREDFERLSAFIHAELGIKMPPSKKSLLEGRLQKRLRLLGYPSFREYCEFLLSPEGLSGEIIHAIDLVTTNKTDFFRESYHFDFLLEEGLSELAKAGAGFARVLRAWSAGCSTGEEPYTLAMAMSEYACARPGFDFFIHASDISTRVLQFAAKGIYAEERITPVPEHYRRKYLLRSRDASKGLVRVKPELREKVGFHRLNFMSGSFNLKDLDIIFCRNVIIYFDKPTQQKLFMKFSECMRPGALLFIGHSESLNGFSLPLEKVSTSIYRRL